MFNVYCAHACIFTCGHRNLAAFLLEKNLLTNIVLTYLLQRHKFIQLCAEKFMPKPPEVIVWQNITKNKVYERYDAALPWEKQMEQPVGALLTAIITSSSSAAAAAAASTTIDYCNSINTVIVYRSTMRDHPSLSGQLSLLAFWGR